MEKTAKLIGNRIKNIRIEKYLSQEDLAYKVNLSPSYYGQLKRGAKSANMETLEKLLYTLGVLIEDFVTNIIIFLTFLKIPENFYWYTEFDIFV